VLLRKVFLFTRKEIFSSKQKSNQHQSKGLILIAFYYNPKARLANTSAAKMQKLALEQNSKIFHSFWSPL
jgi:hypothetical protein